MKLHRKTALVTGGAKGIGQAVARLFAEEGANVVIADFDDPAGEQTAQEIRSRGGSARFLHSTGWPCGSARSVPQRP